MREASPPADAVPGRCTHLGKEAASIWRIVRKYPSTIIWPLAVLGLVLGIGIWEALRLAHIEEKTARDRASGLAFDLAIWYRSRLSGPLSPVGLLAALAMQQPQWAQLNTMFEGFGPALKTQQESKPSTKLIQYWPNGVMRSTYVLMGTSSGAVGTDVFTREVERLAVIRSVRDRRLLVAGPYATADGQRVAILTNPVFISGVDSNETFGHPDPLNPSCGAPCAYNATTRTAFWGFASAWIDLDAISREEDSAPVLMGQLGYRYEVVALGTRAAEQAEVVASSAVRPTDPVTAIIQLTYSQWVVRMEPEGGWGSAHYKGLMAGVICLAAAISVVLFAALVSWRRHQVLLEALLPREVIKDLHRNNSNLGRRIINADTVADVMLALLGQVLQGHMPNLTDVTFVQQALFRGKDVYEVVGLKQHMQAANLDRDVARALMQQLGHAESSYLGDDDDDPWASADDRPHLSARSGFSPGGMTSKQSMTVKGMLNAECATLAGALALILTPQPPGWATDNGDNISDVASDAQLPTVETEAEVPSAGSPRQSNQSMLGNRIRSFLRPSGTVSQSNINALGGPQTVTQGSYSRRSIDIGVESQQPQQHLSLGGPRSPGFRRNFIGPVSGFTAADDATTGERSGIRRDDSAVGGAGAGAGASGTLSLISTPQDDLGLGEDDRQLSELSPRHGPITGRRPPRKVASMSLLGQAGHRLRRRSLLQNATAAAELQGEAVPSSVTPSAQSVTWQKLTGPWSKDASGEMARTITGSAVTVAAGQESICGGRSSQRQLLIMDGSRRSIIGAGMTQMATAQGRMQALPPPPAMIEEVERILAKADSWQFNTWALREATGGFPLSALGFFLIQRAGLITHFNLKPAVLVRLLRHIESGYPDNCYHSATHAADVLQTLHVIIHGAQLHVHYLNPLGLLAAYMAAIVHDYGHPGLTNDFLIATSDPLAVRYNDRSPLENHHSAASFSAMRRPGMDVLAPLTTEQRKDFRKQVIDMVLATDMKQHFTLLSQFNTAHRLASFQADNGAKGVTPRPSRAQHVELHEVVVVVADNSPSATEAAALQQLTAPKPSDDSDRVLSLQLAIKVADLGHLGEELDVHKRWLAGLEEEFFRQGDKEKLLGIPISPLFDRAKQGVSKCQVGFYEFVALPLAHALSTAFPGALPLMHCFESNYDHWRKADAKPPVVEQAATAAAKPNA